MHWGNTLYILRISNITYPAGNGPNCCQTDPFPSVPKEVIVDWVAGRRTQVMRALSSLFALGQTFFSLSL